MVVDRLSRYPQSVQSDESVEGNIMEAEIRCTNNPVPLGEDSPTSQLVFPLNYNLPKSLHKNKIIFTHQHKDSCTDIKQLCVDIHLKWPCCRSNLATA